MNAGVNVRRFDIVLSPFLDRFYSNYRSCPVLGGHYIFYKNIAIPLSIGAQMIARGDVAHRGVVPPETALNPDVFIAELARRKIEIHEKVVEYHVIARSRRLLHFGE